MNTKTMYSSTKTQKLLRKVYLYCLVVSLSFGVTTMYGTENDDSELKGGGQRRNKLERIIELKGAAFFKGIEVDNNTCIALNANDEIFTIDHNPVFIEWKGNKSVNITRVNNVQFSQEFAKQYVYLGLGYADQTGRGLRFLVKVGDYMEEFILESEELPIKKVIKINNKNYVIFIKFEVVNDEWNVIGNKSFSVESKANGYLMEIEYIKPIIGTLEDFIKSENLRIISEIKSITNSVPEKLNDAENQLKSMGELHGYNDYVMSQKQIEEILNEIQKAVKLVNWKANQIEDANEQKEIVSQIKYYQEKALGYLRKAKVEVKNKEKQILEEIEQQAKIFKSILEKLVGILNFLEESFNNDSRAFDEISKHGLIMEDAMDEASTILASIEAKVDEIKHNNNQAQKLFDEVSDVATKIDEIFGQARETLEKIDLREEEIIGKKEESLLEAIKLQEVSLKLKLEQVIKALKIFKNTFNKDEQNFVKMQKYFYKVQSEYLEASESIYDLDSKIQQIGYTETLERRFQEIQNYEIEIRKCYYKALDIAAKINKRVKKLRKEEHKNVGRQNRGESHGSKTKKNRKHKISKENSKEKGSKKHHSKSKKNKNRNSKKYEKTKKSRSSSKHKKDKKSKKHSKI